MTPWRPLVSLFQLTPEKAPGTLFRSLLLLMLVQLIIDGDNLGNWGARLLYQLSFYLNLLVALFASLSRHWLRNTVLVLTVTAVGLRIATTFLESPPGWLETSAMGLDTALLASTQSFVVTYLRHRTVVDQDTVAGSVYAYFLLGVVFAFVFRLLEVVEPQAFGPNGPMGLDTLFYFSLVTLTTLGYGDVHPIAPVARNLAAAEAFIGHLPDRHRGLPGRSPRRRALVPRTRTRGSPRLTDMSV